jgi:hypothetical protein
MDIREVSSGWLASTNPARDKHLEVVRKKHSSLPVSYLKGPFEFLGLDKW